MPQSDFPKLNISRRGLLRGAAGASALAAVGSLPAAPAIAQSARRDLRIGVFGGDFGNLSPVVRWDIQGGLVINNVFDQMVRVDPQSRQVIPWIAEAWTNPDPLTWRIKLREGVKWHRGYGDMRASDVVYTWLYHLESKSFQIGTALFALDSVKVDGDYVVEVKTKSPFGAFPGVTMGYGGLIISQKAHKEMGNQAYGAKPIGQGPFMIETVRGSEVELIRNPDYWRPGLPKLDRLFYRSVPDSSVRMQSLARGELDFITHPEPREVKDIAKNPKFAVARTAGWNWDYQQFNLRGDPKAAFQNKLVRQAISYAIDRKAIVDEIYSGEAVPTDNQIPPGYLGHRASMLRYPVSGNLEKAQELMARSGMKGYEVEVVTSDKDWLRKELELVAAMVSQIGITYKIRGYDMGGYNNLVYNRGYVQQLEDITLVAPDTDASSWWFLNSKGANATYDNSAMDHLLDTARSEIDPQKREALYHGVVDLTLDECPLIYHCNVNYIQVFDKRLTGFSPSPIEFMELMGGVAWS